MKNTKRILSGLLVLIMVMALLPISVFADEAADVTINIAQMTNGTVTADKESYKVGDTVTLTIAPNGGYVQKLYIDGQPLILGWKTKTYKMVTTWPRCHNPEATAEERKGVRDFWTEYWEIFCAEKAADTNLHARRISILLGRS